jgi:tRNA dimethylallyltransferase
VPVIIGPTASGKTLLSLELAARFGGVEIISADSRQIYIGMDIGTAKPSPSELASVPHHMIDIVTPDALYSAGRYAAAARAAIEDVMGRGGVPLVVGGSGFYVKALFEGLAAPTVDQGMLARLQERGEREGYDLLHAELARIDPTAAAAHSPNNHVKTLRALCCYYQTGQLYSSFTGPDALGAAPWRPRYLAIRPPRELLYARIDRRVLAMLEAGLLDETRALLGLGYDVTSPGLRTVGYAEALRHLAGDIDHATMTSAIQQATRRYAKRQMTWFRRVEGVEWHGEPDVAAGVAWLGGSTRLGSRG